MYSWGNNMQDWKNPGGYSFDSARKPYLDKLASDAKGRGGRNYVKRESPDHGLVDVRGRSISSESKNPLVIAVDVTGSMQSWPGEIFDRLPLLYQTLSQYRPDLEICFAAIGDAHGDDYPLQVNDFAKGVTLEDHLNALCPEGGGGGQIHESYELFGYYMDKHCRLPNAKMPFMFIYGDEKFYKDVDPDQVRHYIGDKLQQNISAKQTWHNLISKFNLFYLQKAYDREDSPDIDEMVRSMWADAIGPQRIIKLPNYERAVDIAMAIVARSWGQFGDYTKNIAARQDDKQIALVMKSIRYLPPDPNSPITRNSRLLTDGNGADSERLD